MGLQKYRADEEGEKCANGARPFYSKWLGGPSLALVKDCPNNIEGVSARTVYITGEADSFFSIPAALSWKGKRIAGYITSDESGLVFHANNSSLEKFGLTRQPFPQT
jgi:hypothetical protein